MEFDVIVIGSGPGGYVCAIKNAQLGKKVAIVEKYSTLGGTCLNVGCIPSKALLHSSELFEHTKHLSVHGISVKDVKLDFSKMGKRVKKVVKSNNDGINYLMKKNKITVINGHASFVDSHKIKVEGKEYTAKNIILATGSRPSTIPGVVIDKDRIISSTQALYLEKLPKKLIVIGAGVIGLELGQVYQRLGVEVTVFEYEKKIIPMMDPDLGKELQKILSSQGMKFHLGAAVTSAQTQGKKAIIKTNSGESYEADYCLVATGRRPYTDSLGLDNISLECDKRGFIPTNDSKQTSHPHIYAIGDVTTGPMLAHKAEEEGVLVAEHINGEKPQIHYHLIPGVVYTSPEVASVGYLEKDLKQKIKIGKFPYMALGKARAAEATQGFIKIIADAHTDEILGVHIIGERAADLIAEATLAMEYRATCEDIARTCHAHPTYSEAFKEACMDAWKKASLHI